MTPTPTDGPTPAEFSRIQDGATINAVLPFVRSEIDKMNRAIERRVFQALDTEGLGPQMAVEAWVAYRANRRLLTHFEQIGRSGTSLGERFGEYMETEHGEEG